MVRVQAQARRPRRAPTVFGATLAEGLRIICALAFGALLRSWLTSFVTLHGRNNAVLDMRQPESEPTHARPSRWGRDGDARQAGRDGVAAVILTDAEKLRVSEAARAAAAAKAAAAELAEAAERVQAAGIAVEQRGAPALSLRGSSSRSGSGSDRSRGDGGGGRASGSQASPESKAGPAEAIHGLESSASDSVRWCRRMRSQYGIVVGHSWGTASSNTALQAAWSERSCDAVLATGRAMGCSERYGLPFLQAWQQSEQVVCDSSSASNSRIVCWESWSGSQACELRNVIVDFSHAKVNEQATRRELSAGVLRARCTTKRRHTGGVKAFPMLRRRGLIIEPETNSGAAGTESIVAETCTRPPSAAVRGQAKRRERQPPTFVMSHDDIYNPYHSLADAWAVWLTMRAAGVDLGARDSKEAWQLLNADGWVRDADQYPSHRAPGALMVEGRADATDGVFFDLYRAVFHAGVRPAAAFGAQRVCFDRLVLLSSPPPGHIWEDFWRDNTCSLRSGASPLFAAFASFVTSALVLDGASAASGSGSFGLAPGLDDILRQANDGSFGIAATFVMRNAGDSTKAMATGGSAASRFVANRAELLAALEGISISRGADVLGAAPTRGVLHARALDFGAMPLREQLRAVRSTQLLVGMHGAGLAHALMLPTTRPRCCALLELFPAGHRQRGVANLARHAGVQYASWTATSHETGRSKASSAGTQVKVDAVVELATSLATDLLGLKGGMGSAAAGNTGVGVGAFN